MPRQAATAGSLPQAFEGVKEMQAGGAGRVLSPARSPGAGRRFADRRQGICPGVVASLRNALDGLLACFRCRTLAGRRQVSIAMPSNDGSTRSSSTKTGLGGISTPLSLTHDSCEGTGSQVKDPVGFIAWRGFFRIAGLLDGRVALQPGRNALRIGCASAHAQLLSGGLSAAERRALPSIPPAAGAAFRMRGPSPD